MISIEKNILDQLLDDARLAFPDECCGFLFGSENAAGDRELTELLVVENSKEGDRRRRFEISPHDYLRAERFADETGLVLLGIYHSHPSHPAIPSEHDRVAAQPFFSYVIVSIFGDEIRDLTSWRLDENQQFKSEIIREQAFA